MAIQRINLGTAPSGTGGDTNRSAFTKIDGNFADSANAASRQVGTAVGNVMEVGAFGLGGLSKVGDYDRLTQNGFYHANTGSGGTGAMVDRAIINVVDSFDSNFKWQIGTSLLSGNMSGLYARLCTNGVWSTPTKIYNGNNTTVDPNGFIKNASPIVSLYADKIELNDEAKLQDIVFEKLGVGDYLIKGSTGFAQEGWYIEMPKDANGNVLVAVVYEQLANNDISVKTYAKMFDPDTGDIVANTTKPRDIPAARWIDLRLQALPQTNPQPFNTDETVATNAE